jgi:hypothetical protein
MKEGSFEKECSKVHLQCSLSVGVFCLCCIQGTTGAVGLHLIIPHYQYKRKGVGGESILSVL